MSRDAVAIVQARVGSARFPGKVLAPLAGTPVLAHVIARVREGIGPAVLVVVATSDAKADDPIAAYVSAHLGVEVFRGPLEDVLARFRLCAARYPAEWVLRISADSPLIPPSIVGQVLASGADPQADLVTTVSPRTLPTGCNAELIRRRVLDALDQTVTDPAEREHVTLHCYRHPQQFRMIRLVAAAPVDAGLGCAIDTPDDLRRLEFAPLPLGATLVKASEVSM